MCLFCCNDNMVLWWVLHERYLERNMFVCLKTGIEPLSLRMQGPTLWLQQCWPRTQMVMGSHTKLQQAMGRATLSSTARKVRHPFQIWCYSYDLSDGRFTLHEHSQRSSGALNQWFFSDLFSNLTLHCIMLYISHLTINDTLIVINK